MDRQTTDPQKHQQSNGVSATLWKNREPRCNHLSSRGVPSGWDFQSERRTRWWRRRHQIWDEVPEDAVKQIYQSQGDERYVQRVCRSATIHRSHTLGGWIVGAQWDRENQLAKMYEKHGSWGHKLRPRKQITMIIVLICCSFGQEVARGGSTRGETIQFICYRNCIFHPVKLMYARGTAEPPTICRGAR